VRLARWSIGLYLEAKTEKKTQGGSEGGSGSNSNSCKYCNGGQKTSRVFEGNMLP
jgi:hypothetical protein